MPAVSALSPNALSPNAAVEPASAAARVQLVTLGCARNEVDSSELAGRLHAGGYRLVEDGDHADVVVVNTCGFVEAAKKDSIDTLLAAADTGARVVAVGCLAERYGVELADALPEAHAVLGFDAYPRLPELLTEVLAGRRPATHVPADRRLRLPVTPVDRPTAGLTIPGHGPAPTTGSRRDGAGSAPAPGWIRRLTRSGPVAPLKIASGCDRRCSFCAIPTFRGAFVSRPIDEIVAEAAWLAGQGIRELYLVSENTTSYGKDLPVDRPLERLLDALATVPGVIRVRLSYLQPAETRPSLIRAIAENPVVADYFDLSFQHASAPVLRAMRRFGDRSSFLGLLDTVRAAAPDAGVRSNVIVGFPGETEDDLRELAGFLCDARLDAVGVFGYSDEDGTAAAELPGTLPAEVVAERVERITSLVEELTSQRAEDRRGAEISVLVDTVGPMGDLVDAAALVPAADRLDPDSDRRPGWPRSAMTQGRGAHQAPDIDGVTVVAATVHPRPGDLVRCRVLDSSGVDLLAVPIEDLLIEDVPIVDVAIEAVTNEDAPIEAAPTGVVPWRGGRP